MVAAAILSPFWPAIPITHASLCLYSAVPTSSSNLLPVFKFIVQIYRAGFSSAAVVRGVHISWEGRHYGNTVLYFPVIWSLNPHWFECETKGPRSAVAARHKCIWSTDVACTQLEWRTIRGSPQASKRASQVHKADFGTGQKRSCVSYLLAWK